MQIFCYFDHLTSLTVHVAYVFFLHDSTLLYMHIVTEVTEGQPYFISDVQINLIHLE